MADETKPKRRGAGAGIGELQLLRGSRAGAPLPPVDDDLAGPRGTPPEAPAAVAASALRSPLLPRGEASLLRIEVSLPEELISGVRSQLRPTSTGHSRTLSVALLLQAYVRAVHALGLEIDVKGLSPVAGDEATGRVIAALEAWKCS